MNVRRETLEMVFDTAVNSMDFGSGFLDNEEVEALREVAVLLGVDPMVATPLNFACQYGAPHKLHDGWCCNCKARVTPGGKP